MGKYSFTNEDAESEILTKERLLELITLQQKTIQDIQRKMTEQQEEIDQLKQLVTKINLDKDEVKVAQEEEHSQSKDSIEQTQVVKEDSDNFEMPE